MQAFRVRKQFQYAGWHYEADADKQCKCHGTCGNDECTDKNGSGCNCDQRSCRCSCRVPASVFAGDIWIAEENNPRVVIMLNNRYAVGDASLDTDELLAQDKYKRLLSRPDEVAAIPT